MASQAPTPSNPYFFSGPYPFFGTVLMGTLLNMGVLKLSPRNNMAYCLAVSVLGSVTANSVHAILKLAGHTTFRSPGSGECVRVHDSHIRFIHLSCVEPLGNFFEKASDAIDSISCLQSITRGIFHRCPRIYYYDGKRDAHLLIAGVTAALALKIIFPWFKPSLQTKWQTAFLAALIPTLWSKSTEMTIRNDQYDPGKPWSWLPDIVDSCSRSIIQMTVAARRAMGK